MLSIVGNQFNGEIPNSIGNLINLISFNAAGNQIDGEIPENIGNLVNLERLWLNFNSLDGQIPSTICNLDLLTWSAEGFEGYDSYINGNQLCPPYPDCIAQYVGEQDTSECEEVLLGDVNSDGLLNVLDIISIINIIIADEYFIIADINEDGDVNILDVITLVNILISDSP